MQVTADDIAQLLASAPPRMVPPHLRRAAQGGGIVWLVPLFGLVFGSFGMFFVWLFFPWRAIDDWQLAESEFTVAGEVRIIAGTKMSLNEVPVVEYTVVYLAHDSVRREAKCYSTGQIWREGDAVTVRYLPGDPEVARIDGSRLSKGGIFGGMTTLFPAAGYGIVAWFFISRWRTRQLLERGCVAEVDVQSVEATRTQVNYMTVYKIVLSPLPETGGSPVTVKRWATAEINLLTSHALQKQPIFVLYDPRRPKKLIFPETLIGN